MGWSSGSSLFSEMIDEIKTIVPNVEMRKELYTALIGAFENHDCDTLDECRGEDDAFDEAWEDIYGGDIDETEEED